MLLECSLGVQPGPGYSPFKKRRLPGYITRSGISGYSFRPDLLYTVSSKCLYILELTVGFEANLLNNAIRKTKRCEDLMKRQKHQYESVNFISLSLSTEFFLSLN